MAELPCLCRVPEHSPSPLKQLKLLDAGCGGGILAEVRCWCLGCHKRLAYANAAGLQALARLGATVTGIDPSRESIGVATAHANLQPKLASLLEYRHTDVQTLQAEGKPYTLCSSS